MILRAGKLLLDATNPLKVVDGNARGLHPATVSVLDQLGLLDDARRAALAAWRQPVIRNYRGIATGRVEAIADRYAGISRPGSLPRD